MRERESNLIEEWADKLPEKKEIVWLLMMIHVIYI